MAFDPSGDFYIFSGGSRKLLVFPVDGSAAWIFADSSDGVWVNGALDFSPNGRLYFTGFSGVMWFTPDGESHVFDPVGSSSLTIDRYGAIYRGGALAAIAGTLLRYEPDDPASESVVITGLSAPVAGIASPDASVVYAIDSSGQFLATPRYDEVDGGSELLADVGVLTDLGILLPVGITVFAPVIVGDFNADGSVDGLDAAIFTGCLGGVEILGKGRDCRFADIDEDRDNDLTDFSVFQSVYSP